MKTINVKTVISVNDVADYFIYKSNYDDKRRSTISPLKLQKLIYYAQAWYAAFNEGKKLFDKEIEAWVHGPVVPDIYREYRHFGYNNIVKNLTDVSQNIKENTNISSILEAVWNMYNDLDAKDLEKLTHSETPWKKAREGLSPSEPSNKIITVDSMAEYYRKYLN